MPLLNELVAEAIDRCRDLSRDADEAKEAVSTLSERAKALADRAATEEEEAHGRLQALTGKVSHHEAELERLVEAAASGLHAVEQKAAQAEATAAQLRQRVEKASSELEQRRTSTLAELEQAAERIESEQEQLAQGVQALGESVETRAQHALQEAKELRDATVELGEALHHAWQQVDAGVSALEDALEEQVQGAADRLAESLALKNAAFVALGERLVAGHNKVVEEFLKDFVEDTFAELKAATEPLRASIEALEALCEGSQQALSSRFTEIGTELEGVAGALERIRPVADLAGLLE
jgi:uncharacterized phage infection (PIP) family protein YhgE